MKKINWHYPRKALANNYLKIVYQGAVNRIALLDVRRTGKTSFLLKDFFPEAIEHDFVPVYINLWLEPENPALAIVSAIEQTLALLANSKSNKLKALADTQIKKIEIGNSLLGKVALEFSNSHAIPASPSQLSGINSGLAKLANQVGDKLILIIDEVQHLASLDKFDSIQRTLRTALDTHSGINVVYSGSSRSGIDAMFKDKDKAFFNSAFMIDFPRLDRGFVQHGLAILKKNFNLTYSETELYTYYITLDKSPFWFMQLLNYLLINQTSLSSGIEYINQAIIEDGNFAIIEKSLTQTDKSILQSLCAGQKQIYAGPSIEALSKQVGSKVSPSNIQGSIRKLINKNIISKYGDKFYIELPGLIHYLKRIK